MWSTMRTVFAFVVTVLISGGGCAKSALCNTDEDCQRNGFYGSCLTAGSGSYCAFGDSKCPSELRWDVSAGEGLAGQCVMRDVDMASDMAIADMAVLDLLFSETPVEISPGQGLLMYG